MLAGQFFADRTLFYLGHHGVTIFFVLSGFLIGGIYYKKENISASKFWLSRFLRTYPPYFVMLLVSWLAVYLTRKQPFDFGFLLLIQNFYKEIPYFLVSWSLAVEEHFYLLFALLIICITNKKTQYYFWVSLSVLPALLRILFYKETGEFGFYKTASFLHIDSLATGVVLAYLVHIKKISINSKSWASIMSIVLMLVLFYFISKYESSYTWSVGRTLANLSIAICLLFAYFNKPFAISKSKLVGQTAAMAYSLYLVHPLIIHFSMLLFKRFSIPSIVIQYTITLGLTFSVSYLFYTLIEKKSIELRDQFLNKR